MESSLWNRHLQQWELFLRRKLSMGEEAEGERIKAQRQLNAIACVKFAAVANPQLLKELMDPQSVPPDSQEVTEFVTVLNRSQQNAVKHALGNHALTLIQGPPGTGKTQVIAELCLQLFRQNPAIRILVCSETHIAVNNLISRLSEYDNSISVIRIQDKEQDESVASYSPNAIIEDYQKWLRRSCRNSDIVNLICQALEDTENPSLEKALLLSHSIVGMTCNRVGAYQFRSSEEMFDVVIVDEACKATLPEILLPLTVAKKAVLVGDPKQLPPVFCSEEMDMIREMEAFELQNYMYLDKLFCEAQNVTVLDTQYRMSEQIGTLIGRLFYEGKLKNGRKANVEGGITWMDYKPVRDWPVFDPNAGDKQKIYNCEECEFVENILTKLDEISAANTRVAVIAPYKRQVKMMRKEYSKHLFCNLSVSINTVDGFQGKECEIVIFSLTRTCGSYRFLADARRLNVALSRARDRILIVGYSEYALRHPLFKEIFQASDVLEFSNGSVL